MQTSHVWEYGFSTRMGLEIWIPLIVMDTNLFMDDQEKE
jgi:hypothetical protein